MGCGATRRRDRLTARAARSRAMLGGTNHATKSDRRCSCGDGPHLDGRVCRLRDAGNGVESQPVGRLGGTSAAFDPCAPPSGWPAAKAAGLVAAGNPTLPPVTGTLIPWLDDPHTGRQITAGASADFDATYGQCDLSQLRLSFEGWGTEDTLGAVGWIVARSTGSKPTSGPCGATPESRTGCERKPSTRSSPAST